jgi:hypothetical protein
MNPPGGRARPLSAPIRPATHAAAGPEQETPEQETPERKAGGR